MKWLKCTLGKPAFLFFKADLINTIGESAAMGTAGVVIWNRSEMKTEVLYIRNTNMKSLCKWTSIPLWIYSIYIWDFITELLSTTFKLSKSWRFVATAVCLGPCCWKANLCPILKSFATSHRPTFTSIHRSINLPDFLCPLRKSSPTAWCCHQHVLP